MAGEGRKGAWILIVSRVEVEDELEVKAEEPTKRGPPPRPAKGVQNAPKVEGWSGIFLTCPP